MKCLTFKVSNRFAERRFDKYLSERFPFQSRSWWARAVHRGQVTLHEKTAKPSSQLRGGEICVIDPVIFADHRHEFPAADLQLVYRDEDIVVVDKPAGLIVHPLGTLTRGALTCLLANRLQSPVHLGHRLDRMTSGLMVAAMHHKASALLDEQFRQSTVEKTYLALCHGKVSWETQVVDVPMGRDTESPIRLKQAVTETGKHSRTRFRVRERFRSHTLVEARLDTGRTHQIRLHLAYLGHPIVRDKLYGCTPDYVYYEKGYGNLTPFYDDWQGLHAWQLAFRHPMTGEALSFSCEPSRDFAGFIEDVRRSST